MVRLKVTGLCLKTYQSDVSIPYGTIKSFGRKLREYQVALVSIPYGTIKSGNPMSDIPNTYMFQFLMVRLKGHRAQQKDI